MIVDEDSQSQATISAENFAHLIEEQSLNRTGSFEQTNNLLSQSFSLEDSYDSESSTSQDNQMNGVEFGRNNDSSQSNRLGATHAFSFSSCEVAPVVHLP